MQENGNKSSTGLAFWIWLGQEASSNASRTTIIISITPSLARRADTMGKRGSTSVTSAKKRSRGSIAEIPTWGEFVLFEGKLRKVLFEEIQREAPCYSCSDSLAGVYTPKRSRIPVPIARIRTLHRIKSGNTSTLRTLANLQKLKCSSKRYLGINST